MRPYGGKIIRVPLKPAQREDRRRIKRSIKKTARQKAKLKIALEHKEYNRPMPDEIEIEDIDVYELTIDCIM